MTSITGSARDSAATPTSGPRADDAGGDQRAHGDQGVLSDESDQGATDHDGDATSGPARIATDLRACLGPLVRRLRQVKPDGELTLSQTSVLVRLDREGPATASGLATAEGIRAQSVCTIVNALQDRGLVAREPDPSDRRRVVVSLTAAGTEGLHGARRERSRRLTGAIAGELTPAEQQQLAAAIPLLERITRCV